MATLAQEPEKIIADLILGDSTLTGKLATDAESNPLAEPGISIDLPGFPKLGWRFITGFANTDLQVEIADYLNSILQVNLFGFDEFALTDIERSVDDLLKQAATFDNAIDSTNWKVLALYRESGWRTLDWKERLTTQDGRNLVQRTADFRYRCARKQNA